MLRQERRKYHLENLIKNDIFDGITFYLNQGEDERSECVTALDCHDRNPQAQVKTRSLTINQVNLLFDNYQIVSTLLCV